MKDTYMNRLRRAARWMLPPEDASEVIADYADMAAGRTDEELLRDMGEPAQAVRQTADEKAYRLWLIFFAAMALCAVLPGAFGLHGSRRAPYAVLPLAGALLSAWYWRAKQAGTEAALPKGLLPALSALLGVTAAVQGFLWWIIRYPFRSQPFPTQLYGWSWYMDGFCLLLIPVCIVGLVRARMADRRWRALYVLGLTALALTLTLLKALKGLNLDYCNPAELSPYLTAWYVTAAVGLCLTGWSLC